MKHKVTFLVISMIVIFSMLLGLTASTAQSPALPRVDLGEPGLSYRYVQTYGTLNAPYVADPDYLNSPVGLFMDGSDNLFVIEEWGFRVLKYNPTPTISLTLGTAGHPSWMYGGDLNLFNSPRDGLWTTVAISGLQTVPG